METRSRSLYGFSKIVSKQGLHIKIRKMEYIFHFQQWNTLHPARKSYYENIIEFLSPDQRNKSFLAVE